MITTSIHIHRNHLDMMIKRNCCVFLSWFMGEKGFKDIKFNNNCEVVESNMHHLSIPLPLENQDLSKIQLVTIKLLNLLNDPTDTNRLIMGNINSNSDESSKIYLSKYICNAFDLQILLFNIDKWTMTNRSNHKKCCINWEN